MSELRTTRSRTRSSRHEAEPPLEQDMPRDSPPAHNLCTDLPDIPRTKRRKSTILNPQTQHKLKSDEFAFSGLNPPPLQPPKVASVSCLTSNVVVPETPQKDHSTAISLYQTLAPSPRGTSRGGGMIGTRDFVAGKDDLGLDTRLKEIDEYREDEREAKEQAGSGNDRVMMQRQGIRVEFLIDGGVTGDRKEAAVTHDDVYHTSHLMDAVREEAEKDESSAHLSGKPPLEDINVASDIMETEETKGQHFLQAQDLPTNLSVNRGANINESNILTEQQERKREDKMADSFVAHKTHEPVNNYCDSQEEESFIPTRHCPHLTLTEHTSCAHARCAWTPPPAATRMDYVNGVPILRRPFSRKANLALQRWVNEGPGTVRLREHLESICIQEGEEGAEEVAVGRCTHDMGNDFRREWVEDYVAHWARIWARWEDRQSCDKYDSTTDVEVREEVFDLHEAFPKLSQSYRILDKIGEGTFSSVYKAVDRRHRGYVNDWCACSSPSPAPGVVLEGNKWAECGVVALKRIYVTSSTDRILNELSVIKRLSKKPNIAGLITAMRSRDQIVAALPYYHFDDFREFIESNPSISELSSYMRALMIGLRGIHEEHILHRDIKPTNFLYNRKYKTGVIVDFGLAQQVPSKRLVMKDVEELQATFYRPAGYFETDKRPSIRGANRAGTRGFRAPEVLLRVVQQGTGVDIWAAGVILLCAVTRTYPFFQSNDDLDALLEITAIYGTHDMKRVALANNRRMHITLPYPKRGVSFEEIVTKLNPHFKKLEGMDEEKKSLFHFLRSCLCLRWDDRVTAIQALESAFLMG
ncbi:kinase-like domain-containing protein [Chytriomyces sp. MP71]|nr:kinase-like domain-containing protein [Chytriomyces sp. MP71]